MGQGANGFPEEEVTDVVEEADEGLLAKILAAFNAGVGAGNDFLSGGDAPPSASDFGREGEEPVDGSGLSGFLSKLGQSRSQGRVSKFREEEAVTEARSLQADRESKQQRREATSTNEAERNRITDFTNVANIDQEIAELDEDIRQFDKEIDILDRTATTAEDKLKQLIITERRDAKLANREAAIKEQSNRLRGKELDETIRSGKAGEALKGREISVEETTEQRLTKALIQARAGDEAAAIQTMVQTVIEGEESGLFDKEQLLDSFEQKFRDGGMAIDEAQGWIERTRRALPGFVPGSLPEKPIEPNPTSEGRSGTEQMNLLIGEGGSGEVTVIWTDPATGEEHEGTMDRIKASGDPNIRIVE